jgi:hypothetical protein
VANPNAVHNFFEPQPIKDVYMLFLHLIIHDWPDPYARNILKQLCASAQPSTKLIIHDNLVLYAAPSNNLFSEIPGSEVPTVPYLLLPNLGTISNTLLMADLQVFAVSSRILHIVCDDR